MSQLYEIEAYDAELLQRLVREQRRAASTKHHDSLDELLKGVKLTPLQKRAQKDAQGKLKRVPRHAPDLIRRRLQFQVEPIEYCLDWLRQGEEPHALPLADLARRARLGLNDSYRALRWVADAGARVILREHDSWPYVDGAEDDPAVQAMFRGRSEPAVDGIFVEAFADPTGRTRVAHLAGDLLAVSEFFAQLVRSAPPAVEEYGKWYRALHSERFLNPNATVPEHRALGWDYACFLSDAHRLATKLVRFYRQCERRGWFVVIRQ